MGNDDYTLKLHECWTPEKHVCGKVRFSSVAVSVNCVAFMNGEHSAQSGFSSRESDPGLQETLTEFIKVVKSHKKENIRMDLKCSVLSV